MILGVKYVPLPVLCAQLADMCYERKEPRRLRATNV